MIATLLSMGTTEWLRKMENPDLFEGDIVLSPEQRRRLFSGNFPFGTVKGNYLWPRVIPYSISDELKGNQMAETAIKAAIADYEMFTCLRFVQRRSERNYMHFYKGTGCSSPVGNFGTRNPISLDSGCWHKGIVLHEMMHSLGAYHEQSRPDRDEHVKIHFENIKRNMRYNFRKKTEKDIDSLGTPYDYKSIMHYDSKAFGYGKITIETLDKNMQNVIGQRKGFSKIDIMQLNLLYKAVCSNTPVTQPTNQPQTKVPTKVPKITTRSSLSTEKSETSRSGRCQDLHSCSVYVRMGACSSEKWRDFMQRVCRKSCKFC